MVIASLLCFPVVAMAGVRLGVGEALAWEGGQLALDWQIV